ncbi:MAG: cob(I)yrinic acid a,c-diamide adenosyltransferase [Archaeoglobus sp.]|nr:cob(I)yrinic acid a,c-diamide adenosyltransferase [Archaeoglobus sp.]
MAKKDVRKTHLLDRSLVDKDSDIISCLGTLDEANSFIGLARVFARDEKIKEILEKIQQKMFKAGLELVSDQKLSEEDFEEIKAIVDDFEKIVRKPNKFILLEKNRSSAFLSVARAIVRRAEREAIRLQKEGITSIWLVEWLNKLSYLLYLMVLREIELE